MNIFVYMYVSTYMHACINVYGWQARTWIRIQIYREVLWKICVYMVRKPKGLADNR